MTFCAALKTDSTDKEPEGCTRYDLTACTYAFFEQNPGYLCELSHIIEDKISEAGFIVAENAICFETNAPDKPGQSSSINIWVPVIRQS
jgi:predicted transcriptional regulator YdeE